MSHEIIPKKSLGQHWLRDPVSLQAMVEAAGVGFDDAVLEIGPGFGTLTAELVKSARRVIAVEFDKTLADQLPKRVPAANLQVIHEDILRFDFTNLPPAYKIVANIPYYLTSNLVRVISETPNPPLLAALLMQQEVAERLAAPPGQMSLLSVTAQFYWQVKLGRAVPAELFDPPPKVDSQIVILQRRTQPLLADADAKPFFRLVGAGFSQRRKTLLNSLSAGLRLDKQAVAALCQAANIDSGRRPQTLSLDEWRELYEAWTGATDT